MVIVWGFRDRVKELPVMPAGQCPCCHNTVQMKITHTDKQFVLFYVIPLFPFGGKTYAQCTGCGAYHEVKDRTARLLRNGVSDMIVQEDLKYVSGGTPQVDHESADSAFSNSDAANPAESSADTEAPQYDDPFRENTYPDGDQAVSAQTAPQPVQRAPWEKEVKPAKPGSTSMVFAIIAFIIAGFVGLLANQYIRNLRRDEAIGVIPINDLLLAGETLENDRLVSIDVDASLGQYAEKTENRRKTTYYIIWLDDNTFISLTTSKQTQIEKLDAITESTWAYLNDEAASLTGEAYRLEGRLQSMSTIDNMVQVYYKMTLSEMGIDAGDETVRQMNINCDDTGTTRTDVIGSVIAAAVFLGIGLVCLAVSISAKKKAAEGSPS